MLKYSISRSSLRTVIELLICVIAQPIYLRLSTLRWSWRSWWRWSKAFDKLQSFDVTIEFLKLIWRSNYEKQILISIISHSVVITNITLLFTQAAVLRCLRTLDHHAMKRLVLFFSIAFSAKERKSMKFDMIPVNSLNSKRDSRRNLKIVFRFRAWKSV